MERAVLMARGLDVDVADLGLRRRSDGGAPRAPTLEEVERVLIEKALERHRWQRQPGGRGVGVSVAAPSTGASSGKDVPS